MQRQEPVHGQISTRSAALGIVMHPALRLGFLDAQAGKPFDHDRIMERIASETPPRALDRIGWYPLLRVASDDVRLAQYRYEEGRLLVTQEGLRCRKWGHPDFPPAQVMDWIDRKYPVVPTPLPDNMLELWRVAARSCVKNEIPA